jgi:PadR family transcriptional regulator, multidrug transcriptional repressor LadR
MASKSKTQYALLGMLSFKPMSGYEIKKHITEGFTYFWNESYGQIYKTLTSLLQTKMIKKKHMNQIGRPNKDVYSITVKGLSTLKEYLSIPPDKLIVRDEMLLKLALGFNGRDKDSIRLLEDEIESIKEHISLEDKRIKESGLNEEADKRKVKYVSFLIDLQRTMALEKMKWCKKTIKLIKNDL